MSIDTDIKQGNFELALERLASKTSGPQPDLGEVLMRFNLEVRLQRFEEAEASIQRLREIAPDAEAPVGELRDFARAEAKATRRLVDPEAAGARSILSEPPPHWVAHIKAAVRHAQKDDAGAKDLLQSARTQSPRCPCTLTWRSGRTERYVDLTDSDDLTGPIVPAYSKDAVYDLAYSQIRSIAFRPAQTSFDVMWIPSEIAFSTGQSFLFRVPGLYTGSGISSVSQARTGEMTVWNHDRGYARAAGQRDIKATHANGGVTMIGIFQLARIEFHPSDSA